ncbi:MAG: hypothetical protein V5A88_09040 [Candidatus Thermoplasmatota archaeon]
MLEGLIESMNEYLAQKLPFYDMCQNCNDWTVQKYIVKRDGMNLELVLCSDCRLDAIAEKYPDLFPDKLLREIEEGKRTDLKKSTIKKKNDSIAPKPEVET